MTGGWLRARAPTLSTLQHVLATVYQPILEERDGQRGFVPEFGPVV